MKAKALLAEAGFPDGEGFGSVNLRIDIKDINLIINFDVPGSAEDYVHRVGRTARADKTGIAISLINEHDMDKFDKIEKLIEMEVLKIPVPPELGEGPVYKVRPPRKGGSRPQAKRKFSSGGRPGRGGANQS